MGKVDQISETGTYLS